MTDIPHVSSAVIEPEAVDGARNSILLDVRGEADYLNQRFSGAVRVPIERWEAAAKAPKTGLENETFWQGNIGALGIDGGKRVLVYDDGRLTEAARVWFILQHFRVPAAIVNGGWPALRSLYAHQIASGPASAPTPVHFLARAGKAQVGIASRETVKGSLEGETRIWDARTAAEYDGRDLRNNARGGHLPGATLLRHSELLDSKGRLKSAVELKTLIAMVGFEPGQSLITHCDGGGRAALAAIAAVEAGYSDVSAYYLSFSDWAKDDSCPVERT